MIGLTAERDEDVRARTAIERKQTAYGNRVPQVNQALVTARQAATQADARRIRTETSTQTVRQELVQARTERDTATTRHDALEDADTQLTRERDAVVVESAGVQVVRECLQEANEYVERLTTSVNELYQANLAQVEPLYTQQRGAESNARFLEGLHDSRAHSQIGSVYLHHALNALSALTVSRCMGDAAAARAQAAASAIRAEIDAIDTMIFRRRIERRLRVRFIAQQRTAELHRILPPPIVTPVRKGSQTEREYKRILAALGQIENLSLEEDSQDNIPITRILQRLDQNPQCGEGGDDGGEGGAAAL